MARYQVDERLLNALIQQESRGNNNAVSPKGALGLAQVMPETARNPGFGVSPLRSSAPEEQVRFANDYLGAMLERYNGNAPMALAAYNAGPGAVDKAGGVPNYPETQNYVKKILTSMNPIGEANASETPYVMSREEFKSQALKQAKPVMSREQFKANMMAQQVPQTQQAQQAEQPQEQSFGQRIGADIDAIPRQAGLTARYAMEGAASIPDIVAAPVISMANQFLPEKYQQKNLTQTATSIANTIGLPSPENSTERVVGDITRLGVGGGGLVKGAGMAANALTGTGKAVASALAANPSMQMASAIGSGAAGGVTREAGGGPTAQVLASLAGAFTGAGLNGLYGKLTGISTRGVVTPQQISDTIDTAVSSNGIKLAEVPPEILAGLKDDVKATMQKGELSPDALKRLIDYRLVGATPAKGNLTLKPADVTQQKNLAKIGINTNDPTLQALGNQQNENVGVLIDRLNQLGAGGATDKLTEGNKLIKAIKGPIATKEKEISTAYSSAKNNNGASAVIDANAFKTDAYKRLEDEMADMSLTPAIKKQIEAFASGEKELTVGNSEQFKKVLSRISRTSSDGNERYAAGLVRKALDDAPLVSGSDQGAIEAFDKARGLFRDFKVKAEKTPALQAVLDDVSPDKFVTKYVIDADFRDLAQLKSTIKNDPIAIAVIKNNLIKAIKKGAVGVNPDEARAFSQSGLNKMLDKIGDQKLKMFLSKNEFNEIKALGRVSLYEQLQPVGSAVNNSNTAALMISKLDSILNKVPLGKEVFSQPVSNIINSYGAKNITNPQNALLMRLAPKERTILGPLLLLPSAANADNRKNNKK